ncbi:polysialic acid transporter [Hydrococcus rivularis NIES-593]|uniref:Polysialic acid transporter n=1 Tax=Hydrococcus rivularis NIES-593 TaxID=1921803 RepID=A0A1U7H9B8_9CYAN|nr:ABC transporter permease [Hydrococcus rivularis]OKH20154.1 polysialic acid transporter [Hydrococcus rivularis NIES-593]
MQQSKQLDAKGDQALKPVQQSRKDLPVIVYAPESRLRSPGKLFKEMWYDLLASRDLAWQLLIRDISAQYRQSVLGILWAFIPPLVTALGLSLLQNNRIVNLGKTDIPYPLYVLFSMTLWQMFTDSMNNSMGAVKAAKSMLSQIRVPAEAFVIAKLGQTFFNFSVQLILVVILFIVYQIQGQLQVSWSVILAPVALIHLVMFGTAIGLILGPLSSLYSDVNKAMSFIIRIWFFITPVIFALPRGGHWATLVKLNPVTPLLVTTRELATTGNISYPIGFWVASAIAIISFCLGWTFYRLAMPFIVERAAMS